MADYTGQTFHERTVLGPEMAQTPRGLRTHWKWRCDDCQAEGVSCLSHLKRAGCSACRLRGKKDHSIRSVFGPFTILRDVTLAEVTSYRASHKTPPQQLYYVRCVRCYAEGVRSLKVLRNSRDKAITCCSKCRGATVHMLNGRPYTAQALADEHGLKADTVRRHFQKGSTPESAITLPTKMDYTGQTFHGRKILGSEVKQTSGYSYTYWRWCCDACQARGSAPIDKIKKRGCNTCCSKRKKT